MTRVIIVHGFRSKPDTNWKPWLRAKLEELGVSVEVPEMPNTESPIASEWVQTLSNIVGSSTDDTYLVGHSLGCITILRYLESLGEGQRIGGCLFIAGFTRRFNKYHGGHDTFFDHELDWGAIKSHCSKFVAIHSSDDMNVESAQLRSFAEKLAAKTMTVEGMGHFGSADGVHEVPLVLDELNRLIDNS